MRLKLSGVGAVALAAAVWLSSASARGADEAAADGWPLWEAAFARHVTWWHDDRGALDDAAQFDTRIKSERIVLRLNAHVTANNDAINLFIRGIEAGRVDVPARGPDGKAPSLVSVRKFVNLLMIRGRLALAANRPADAVRDFGLALDALRLVSQRPASILTLVFADATAQAVARNAAMLAQSDRLNDAQRAALVGALDRFADRPLAPRLAGVIDGVVGDSVTLVSDTRAQIKRADDALREQRATGQAEIVGVAEPQALTVYEPYRELLKVADQLDKKHRVEAKLADAAATETMLRQRLAPAAEAADAGWPDLRGVLASTLDDPADELAQALDADRELAEKAVGLGGTTSDAEAAGEALSNAIGRRAVVDALNVMGMPIREHRAMRAAIEAVKIQIAAGAYRAKTSQNPPTLAALVEAKLLAAVPADPFGAGAMNYDAERGVIWSVGPDGEDNAGETGPDKDATGAGDLVWPITPPAMR